MNSTHVEVEPSTSRARFLSSRWRVRLAWPVFVLTIGVATAGTTAPGHNGRIAFRRYFDDQQSWGAVFTMTSKGAMPAR